MFSIGRFLCFICLFSVNVCFACDICGSSGGGYQINSLRVAETDFIACRYGSQRFYSQMAADASDFSDDHYQGIEISAGVSLRPGFHISVTVPYRIHQQEMRSHTHSANGLGDLIVMTKWSLPIIKVKKNEFILGAGIKLPSGKFDPNLNQHIIPSANLQTGTGSVDFLINASDIIKLGNWSVIADTRYKINTVSKDFHFGNRFSGAVQISKSIDLDFTKLILNTGVIYDHLAHDKFEKKVIIRNGGYAVIGNAGIYLETKKIGLGINRQLPIAQEMAGGQTRFESGWMIQTSYSF